MTFDRIQLGDRLRAGAGNEVRAGTLDGAPVLVTITAQHAVPSQHAPRLDFDGIARLVWVGNVDHRDALVEALPAGQPARGPLDEQQVRSIGRAVASVLARVHAAGDAVYGIQPDLIYLTDDAQFSGLVPRGPHFIASAKQVVAGLPSYPIPYVGYDALVLGNGMAQPGDVFALCASLFVLRNGRYPFGEHIYEILPRVRSHDHDPWPGPLGELVARGLAQDPAQRPTAAELAAALT